MITTLPSGIAPLVGQQATGAKSTRNDFNQWLRSEPSSDDAGADKQAAPSDPTAQIPRLQPQPVREGVFGLHVRDARGTEELVSVPWGLAASGRLSLLSHRAIRLPAEQVGEPAANIAASVVQAGFGQYGRMLAPIVATQSTGPGLEVIGQGPVNHPAGSTGLESPGAADSGGPPGTPYAAPWLSRLMRWVEQGPLPQTVWIRDFTLDESAKQRLADLVRELADEHGVRLRRIVVNSHEIWSAAGGASKENG